MSLDTNKKIEDANQKQETALIPYDPFNNHKNKLNLLLERLLRRVEIEEEEEQGDEENEEKPLLINDIIPNILSYCDAKTLSTCSVVCKEWNTYSTNNDLWEHLCCNVFGVSAKQIKPPPDPTKKLYILQHRSLRQACRRSVLVDTRQLFGRTMNSSIPVSSFRPSWR